MHAKAAQRPAKPRLLAGRSRESRAKSSNQSPVNAPNFVRLRTSTRSTFYALGPSLFLLFGCSSEPCLRQAASLDVRIENGAYEQICAYEVRARPPQGKWFDLPCVVEGSDCRCSGGERAGTFEVALDGQGSNDFAVELETKTVEVEQGSCRGALEDLVFERPPMDEFIRENCEAAIQNLEACRSMFVLRPETCIDTRPAMNQAQSDELDRCYFGCFVEANCDTLKRSLCVGSEASAEITSLVSCLGGCFEFPADDLQALANSMARTCEQ